MINKATALHILTHGVIYYPAWKHYGKPTAIVNCDYCNKTSLHVSVGCTVNGTASADPRMDLCMSCVDDITGTSQPRVLDSSFVCRASFDPQSDLDHATFMLQDTTVPFGPILGPNAFGGPTTLMAQSSTTPRARRTKMAQSSTTPRTRMMQSHTVSNPAINGHWYYEAANCYVPNAIDAVPSLNHNTHYKGGGETEACYSMPDYTVAGYHSKFCKRVNGKWYFKK